MPPCASLQAEVPPEYPARPELAVAALVYLLARFPLQPCPIRADAILSHLLLVAADERQPQELRRIAAGAAEDWQRLMTGVAADAPLFAH